MRPPTFNAGDFGGAQAQQLGELAHAGVQIGDQFAQMQAESEARNAVDQFRQTYHKQATQVQLNTPLSQVEQAGQQLDEYRTKLKEGIADNLTGRAQVLFNVMSDRHDASMAAENDNWQKQGIMAYRKETLENHFNVTTDDLFNKPTEDNWKELMGTNNQMHYDPGATGTNEEATNGVNENTTRTAFSMAAAKKIEDMAQMTGATAAFQKWESLKPYLQNDVYMKYSGALETKAVAEAATQMGTTLAVHNADPATVQSEAAKTKNPDALIGGYVDTARSINETNLKTGIQSEINSRGGIITALQQGDINGILHAQPDLATQSDPAMLDAFNRTKAEAVKAYQGNKQAGTSAQIELVKADVALGNISPQEAAKQLTYGMHNGSLNPLEATKALSELATNKGFQLPPDLQSQTKEYVDAQFPITGLKDQSLNDAFDNRDALKSAVYKYAKTNGLEPLQKNFGQVMNDLQKDVVLDKGAGWFNPKEKAYRVMTEDVGQLDPQTDAYKNLPNWFKNVIDTSRKINGISQMHGNYVIEKDAQGNPIVKSLRQYQSGGSAMTVPLAGAPNK